LARASARTAKRAELSAVDIKSLLRNPFVRPIIEFALWTVAFWIASIIHQQPIYYIVLLFVFARDLENVSEKRKGLFRDFVAATMTAIIGWVFNDSLSRVLGSVIALVAGIVLAQQVSNRIKQRIEAWLNS